MGKWFGREEKSGLKRECDSSVRECECVRLYVGVLTISMEKKKLERERERNSQNAKRASVLFCLFFLLRSI